MKFYPIHIWMALAAFGLSLSSVSCGPDDGDPEEVLYLSQKELIFSAEESSLSVDIKSNSAWTVSFDDADHTWVQCARMSGTNSATIDLNASENTSQSERTATVTVSTKSKSKKITVVQKTHNDRPEEKSIFYENAGDVPVTGTMLFSSFDGWSGMGTGSAGVTYSAKGMPVIGMEAASSGYDRASGGNNIFFTSGEQEFVVENIDVTDTKSLTVSFGVSDSDIAGRFRPVTGSTVKLSASLDGVDYTPLEYTNSDGASWVFARSEFRVPDGAAKLFIKLGRPYEAKMVRIDDILVESGGNGTVEVEYSALRFGDMSVLPYAAQKGKQTALTVTMPYAGSVGRTETVSVRQGSTQIVAKDVLFQRGEGSVSIVFNYTPSIAGKISLDVYIGNAKAGSVEVFVASKIVYYENFSATKDYTYWPSTSEYYYVSEYTDFLKQNQSGAAYSNEPLPGSGTLSMVNVGNSLYPPSKERNGHEYYPGASGSFNIRFGSSETLRQIFEIKGLDTSEFANMLMTFGLNIWNKDIDFVPGNRFVLNVSVDQGTTWSELIYETLNNGTIWTLARVTSEIPRSNNLYVRFIPIGLAFRVDDIIIYGY